MAYIGRGVDIGNFEKQTLIPNSVTTTFTLTFAVGSANSLLVVYGGVIQEPAVAYSVSGGGQQIVFSTAPATGTTTYIIYLGKQLTTPRAAGQETTKQTFAGDGSTVTFTLTDPPVVPAGIMVFVDGILQREGSGNNYVSSGSTITFTSAPDSGAEIDVYTLVKEKVSIDTVADGSITFAKLVAGSPTWNGAGETVIATASTGNSLRITNTGSGNSLLVEDSTNPDSTPFVIDNAGNVGIGTSSPTQKLDVTGTAAISGAVTLSGGTANGVAFLNGSKVLTTGSALKFDGTNLAVGGGGGQETNISPKTILFYNTGAGDALIRSADDSSTVTSIAVNKTEVKFYSSGSEQMRLTSTGLGIGLTNPDAKLTVYGGLAGTGIVARFQNPVSGGSSKIGFTDTLTYNWTAGTTNNNFTISSGEYGTTAGTERMRIDSTGNVGIGTSSPAAKLDVAGSMAGASVTFSNFGSATTAVVGLGDGNTGLFRPAAQTLGFTANGSERMRIDSSGNLGLGVTPSAWGQSGTLQAIQIKNTAFAGSGTNAYWGSNWFGGGFDKYIQNGAASLAVQTGGQHIWYTAPSGTAGNAISFNPVMELSSTGGLTVIATPGNNGGITIKGSAVNSTNYSLAMGVVGISNGGFSLRNTTNSVTTLAISPQGRVTIGDSMVPAYSATLSLNSAGNSYNLSCSRLGGGTGSTGQVVFENDNGAIGSIFTVGSATVYNTSSDYRLKTVIGPVANAGQRIDALQPVEYTWNASGERTRGFLAHQFAEVYASSVSGTKDAVDDEGKPVYQAMQASTSEVIADLVAEIQSLRQRLAAAGI